MKRKKENVFLRGDVVMAPDGTICEVVGFNYNRLTGYKIRGQIVVSTTGKDFILTGVKLFELLGNTRG